MACENGTRQRFVLSPERPARITPSPLGSRAGLSYGSHSCTSLVNFACRIAFMTPVFTAGPVSSGVTHQAIGNGSPFLRLLWKTDTPLQVSKARIASQGIEPGIHPDKWHSSRTIAVSFFEPGERLVFF